MGLAHGEITPYESAVHTIGSEASLNLWLPMPFGERARITLTDESEEVCSLLPDRLHSGRRPRRGMRSVAHVVSARESDNSGAGL